MEAIIKNITELFYQHDCVVIPRLGGFLANYQPAFFDEKNNLMVPPKKEFIFNRFLLHNDGLLAHHLSADLKISYNDAVLMIDQFVNSVFDELKSNKTIKIDLVGTLYYDQTNVLRLNSHSRNYLLSSFGLPMVKSLPKIQVAVEDTTPVVKLVVPKTENKEKVTPEPTEIDEKVIPITGRQKSSNAKWWVAAALLPIAFYSAWIPMKTDLFNQNGHFHYSDLNPFVFEKPVSTYTPLESNKTLIDSLYFEFNPIFVEDSLSTIISDSTFEDTSNTTIIETTPEITSNGDYHLIGGCFSSEDNANNFVADMVSQGYAAQIVDQAGGLYRVSVANFATNDDAKTQKNSLKNDHNISTWILKKTQK